MVKEHSPALRICWVPLCNHGPVRGGRGHVFLPVSGLSIVLVAQWAWEALTLSPLRHQL